MRGEISLAMLVVAGWDLTRSLQKSVLLLCNSRSLPDAVANIYQNNKVQRTHQCYSILPPFITSNPRWLETGRDTTIVNCKKHFAWRVHVSLNTRFYTPTMVKQFTFRSSLFWQHKSVGFIHPPSKAGKHNAHCWTNNSRCENEWVLHTFETVTWPWDVFGPSLVGTVHSKRRV